MFYNDNGKVSGIFSNGKLGSTEWSVIDTDKICIVVKQKDQCFDVYQNGSRYKKYMLKADGTRVLVFSIETVTNGDVNQYQPDSIPAMSYDDYDYEPDC